jgi:hypothetical protein
MHRQSCITYKQNRVASHIGCRNEKETTLNQCQLCENIYSTRLNSANSVEVDYFFGTRLNIGFSENFRGYVILLRSVSLGIQK